MPSTMMTPYETRSEAAYWSGGVIVEAAQGGYWSLHGYSTPTGPELYHCGRSCRADGWPPEVRGVYVWAVPRGGASVPTICLVDDSARRK